jgi:magnesium-protoporphyrin O-methyltransferase
MNTATYIERRGQLERYFDRTAVQAWARLTSNAPVSRIRATVRAGRDRMRATLLEMLPADLSGQRVLDAGCGTGAMSLELARRGARVVAIDLSPTLVELARERIGDDTGPGSIEFMSGDMTDAALGEFAHVVAMDSLIHYRADDVVRALSALGARCHKSVVFTFAPSTPALQAMYSVGKLFPRSDRSPAIVPLREQRLRRQIAAEPALAGWSAARTQRIASGFYTSQALELART